MPRIRELRINTFRNLNSVVLQPSLGLNLIYGENGSGKTSLLEAISVLAHGRSFRTHKFRRLISDTASETTLFAQVLAEGGDLKMGVNRSRSGDSTFRIDGHTVQSAAALATSLPLLVMDAHSFLLLEGSAKVRRQFFDWLVFHVKHEFKELWKAYSKCLKHRNALLRRDKISQLELAPWDTEFISLSRSIEALRLAVLEPYLAAFNESAQEFGFDAKRINVSYANGWKNEALGQEALDANFERDVKQGFSSLGPHKSDLKITIGSTPAVELLSRGQQKVLISALYLAEAKIKQQQGSKVVFLLDDLPAELDENHIRQLASCLNALECQLFVTGVSAQKLQGIWPSFKELDHAMFHVKHGEVKQENNLISGQVENYE